MEALDNGARIWLINFARKNLWRIPHWYGLDALTQDGYMVYYRVLRRYIDIKTRSHLMALFKVCFANHIHDLSKLKTRYCEVEFSELISATLHEDSCEGVSVITMSAPYHVQCLMQAMLTDDGQKKLRKPYRSRKRGRETTNERWCRVAGVSPRGIDLPNMVRIAIKNGDGSENDNNKGL